MAGGKAGRRGLDGAAPGKRRISTGTCAGRSHAPLLTRAAKVRLSRLLACTAPTARMRKPVVTHPPPLLLLLPPLLPPPPPGRTHPANTSPTTAHTMPWHTSSRCRPKRTQVGTLGTCSSVAWAGGGERAAAGRGTSMTVYQVKARGGGRQPAGEVGEGEGERLRTCNVFPG